MSFRNDKKGFIFSLDATLAILVVMIVMAGVARVSGPELVYMQHGYLRLERYAEDALEVISLTGALDNVINLIVAGNLSQASEVARDNLRAILPREIQFKFMIGDEKNPYLDNVYPGTDDQAWGRLFNSAEEMAVASRVTAKRLVPLKVLVWVDTRLPGNQTNMIENFVWRIRKSSWDVRTMSDEGIFRNYLFGGMDWTPDVVFIPDSMQFQKATIDALIWYFNIEFGGVVGGGGFLYYNSGYSFPFFGIWVRTGTIRRELGHDNMYIVNHEHPITTSSPDYVKYAGDNYFIYEYLFLNPSTGQKATPLVDNLAYWLGSAHPELWRGYPYGNQDWVALTARRSSVIGENLYHRTVLFNAHLAQSAISGRGTDEWIDLAQRAIEWVSEASLRFTPIKLFVWRSEGVG